MVVLFSRISSKLERKGLIGIATANGLLFLNPKKVASVQSLKLAEHLAKKSIAAGTNISKKLHIEFLLWLAGKKDISRALDELLFEDNQDILIVGMETHRYHSILKQITDKKRKTNLKDKSTPDEIEMISLSRI